mmetsp:Transcript_33323/g.74692  ORF Transcript_33323/g.74692 Transcript_33323/m.74692 type:complete len:262 (-) Transcript_33323:338-1123(-)
MLDPVCPLGYPAEAHGVHLLVIVVGEDDAGDGRHGLEVLVVERLAVVVQRALLGRIPVGAREVHGDGDPQLASMRDVVKKARRPRQRIVDNLALDAKLAGFNFFSWLPLLVVEKLDGCGRQELVDSGGDETYHVIGATAYSHFWFVLVPALDDDLLVEVSAAELCELKREGLPYGIEVVLDYFRPVDHFLADGGLPLDDEVRVALPSLQEAVFGSELDPLHADGDLVLCRILDLLRVDRKLPVCRSFLACSNEVSSERASA